MVFDIPSGMCRSVENAEKSIIRHPVRDASLTGCCFFRVLLHSTKRHIPDGMPRSIIVCCIFHVPNSKNKLNKYENIQIKQAGFY